MLKQAHIPSMNGIIISDPAYDEDVWCRYESNVVAKDWMMHYSSRIVRDEEYPKFSDVSFSLIIGNEIFASRIKEIDDRLVYPSSLALQTYEIGLDTARFCCGAKDKVNHFGEMMAIDTGSDGLLGDVYEFKLDDQVVAICFMGSIDSDFVSEESLFQHFKSGFDAIEKENNLNHYISKATKDRLSNEQKQVIENLISIGLGSQKDYKPTVWKYATKLMDELSKLGYTRPHDFGRGKGKWELVHNSKEDVIQQVSKQMNPEIKKIIKGYQNYQSKQLDQKEK